MDDMLELLVNGLNKEQTEAVKETEGYIRVVAGPGSGKTKVLTNRYVYISKVLGISASHILSVTFTNKAAGEMKRRIRNYMPDEDGGWIGTFHSICNKILKEEIQLLNYPKNFIIISRKDQKDILQKIYDENNFTSKDLTFKKSLDNINFYKNNSKYAEILTDINYSSTDSRLPEPNNTEHIIIRQYLIEQRKNFYLDFDDLVLFVLYLFATNETVCKKWQNFFEYIQVDEFQDVSKSQFALVSILSSLHKNLFVVGDPDQTIYSWRGAKVGYFLDFSKLFPDTKTIMLNLNYRSTPQILAASNSLISNNTERIPHELISTCNEGANVVYYNADTHKDETDYIAQEIEKLHNDGVPFKDIAILYRTHNLTRGIEESLLNKHIDYTIYDSTAFYDREEIKDSISYLRLIDQDDNLSFLRVVNKPLRGIGKTRIKAIISHADTCNISYYEALKELSWTEKFKKTKTTEFIKIIENVKLQSKKLNILDLLDLILRDSGYENMLQLNGDEYKFENINELKAGIRDYIETAGEEVTLNDYLNSISLLTTADRKNKDNTVNLMTVHAAKGLEFPYVFVCCLNEGIFPSSKCENKKDMEEERRLAFVAFTRAKKKLNLTSFQYYDIEKKTPSFISRFIFDIKKELLSFGNSIPEEFIVASKEEIHKKNIYLNKKETQQAVVQYKKSMRVKHPVFGLGTILVVDRIEGDIYVEFDNGAKRTITYKSLEIVSDPNDKS